MFGGVSSMQVEIRIGTGMGLSDAVSIFSILGIYQLITKRSIRLQFLELAHNVNIAPIKKMALLYQEFGNNMGLGFSGRVLRTCYS